MHAKCSMSPLCVAERTAQKLPFALTLDVRTFLVEGQCSWELISAF